MTRLRVFALLAALSLFAQDALAEPYLAVQKGLKCATCHTTPSGGGLRTLYGNAYARNELAARSVGFGSEWSGEISRFLAIGADIRGGWSDIDVPGQPSTSDTDLEKALGYVEIRAIPKYLSLYVDARLAPDDPEIREQYARLTLPDGKWSLRAGEFFLPYGLRLQDDSAFIRQVSGINFSTPDTGWELGFEQGQYSVQFAVTRGTAGGPEVDSGKQYSLRAAHVTPKWQAGVSLNLNDARIGDRQMQNIFAGIRTGPVAWLAEVDYIIDDSTPTGRRKLWATLVEANYGYRKGHNLKLTFEWFDPDDDLSEDEQNRISAVWEYTPIQYLQARIGYRNFSGIPQNPAQNREQLFAELHVFF